MVRRDSRRAVCGCAVALSIVLPAAAAQAVAPLVNTGGVKGLSDTAATLTGWVNAGGEATSYHFEYGPTIAYGTATPSGAAAGLKKTPVTTSLAGLTRGAIYHYRLVAQNASGTVPGLDHKFKAITPTPPPGPPPPGGGTPPPGGGTPPPGGGTPTPVGTSPGAAGGTPAPSVGGSSTPTPQLALTFAASPAMEPFGTPSTLSGHIAGTAAGGRSVVLQANPWPFSRGFQDVGAPVAADAAGNFAFGGLTAPLTTQYRAVLADTRSIASPNVQVGVELRVGLRLRRITRVRRGHRVMFAGTIAPKADGARVSIQRKHGSSWITVARTLARRRDGASSTYRQRVRVLHGGTFRVRVAAPNGGYLPNTREVVIQMR